MRKRRNPVVGDYESAPFLLSLFDFEALDEALRKHSHLLFNDAVSLYQEIEFLSPLHLLHALPRKGRANALRGEVQQSYGHHLVLLIRAVAAISQEDVEWFRMRVENGKREKSNDALLRKVVVEARHALIALPTMALFLGCAFHDIGKLFGTKYDLDVVDASLLTAPLFSRTLSERDRWFADFLVKNHDEIERLQDGESRTSILLDHPANNSFRMESDLLPALGIIQLAGAASLGEGRLTDAKLEFVYKLLCGDMSLLPDDSQRMTALLGENSGTLNTVATAERDDLLAWLGKARLHGWQKQTRHLSSDERLTLLKTLWRTLGKFVADETHVVLQPPQSGDHFRSYRLSNLAAVHIVGTAY